MTVSPQDLSRDQLAALEEQLGSEISAYQPWLGIDVETGDWWDTTAKFEVADIEAMLTLDGRARAVEQAITLPLRAAPLSIKGANGDTGEAEMVNTMLEAMVDTPLQTVIGQWAQSLINRITYQEKCFTVTDDGKIGYKAIAWRPADSCGLLRDRGTGAVTGFTQDLYGKPQPARIMGPKAAVFIHGANRDPVRGVTEMSVSYRCFRDKQKLRALWMLLLERLGAPWVIARTQAGQENAVATTLSKLRGGGVAAVSGVEGVEVLSVTGEVGRIFQTAVQFLDAEMAGSVLAGFLDLASAASRGAGSLALSQDQTDFFADSMEAAAREIAQTCRNQIVTPLVRYNRGPKAVIPDVILGPIGGATSEQLLVLAQSFANAPAGQSVYPQEFIDEIVLRLAGVLDLDLDKIQAAIKTIESAPVPPAAETSQPLHAAVTELHRAATATTQLN